MWGWVKALVSPIADIGTQYLENKKALAQAEADRKIAIVKSKARLAEGEQTHNNAKELKTLEKASPWVRWVIVGHVLALFDVGILYPDRAVIIYKNLEAMPDWVVGLFVTVFAFYFAVDRLSEKGADLVSAWRAKKP